MKYASFGSILSGTHRPEALIPAFISELDYHVARNDTCDESFCQLCSDAQALFDSKGNLTGSPDEVSGIILELENALGEFAPPLGYFGAHPGDGADFGFWLSEDFRENFDGLEVSDTSEVPADYSGDVLHVNDHGNVTLYSATDGKLSEIWALV